MKNLQLILATLVVAAIAASPAFAQTETAETARAANWGIPFGVGMGAGLTLLAAGLGIGLIGSRAVESMARQPEVATNVQGAMIVSAALIEGATFFSLIVVLLILVLF